MSRGGSCGTLTLLLCTPSYVLLTTPNLTIRANVGYHRANATAEVQTPAIDRLVADGVELNRMYAYAFCAPSRAALMSGRLPRHSNSQNIRGQTYDPEHPEVGGEGVRACTIRYGPLPPSPPPTHTHTNIYLLLLLNSYFKLHALRWTKSGRYLSSDHSSNKLSQYSWYYTDGLSNCWRWDDCVDDVN